MEQEKRSDATIEADEQVELVAGPDCSEEKPTEENSSDGTVEEKSDAGRAASQNTSQPLKATVKTQEETKKPPEPLASEPNVSNSIFFLRVGAALFDAVVVGILAIAWLYLSTAFWQISLSARAGIPWSPEYVLTLVSPYSVTYTWMIGVGSALWPIVSPMIGLAAAVSAGPLRAMNPESFWIAIANVCLAPIVMDACYRILMERSPLKATLGKRLLGIYVADNDGKKLAFAHALLRYLSRVLSIGPFWIGLSFALFNKERQVAHDRMSKTQIRSDLPPVNVRKRAPYSFLVCGLFFAFVVNVCLPAVLSGSQSMVPQGSREYYTELAKSNHLVEQERWTQALAKLQPLVQEHPENVQAHMLYAQALRETGEYAKSIEQADYVLKLDPYSSTGFCMRAAGLEKLGKTEEALKDYTAAAILNPRHQESLMRRAILLNQLGRPKEALADAQAAVALEPGNIDAQSALATAYTKLHRWNDASSALRVAFNQSTGKKRREYLHQLGICQYNAKEYTDAKRSFNLGFKLESPSEPALRAESMRYVAECEVMQKDWAAAGSAIDAALKLAPDKATYFYLRSCISYLDNNLETARTEAKQALDKGLKDPSEETQRAILRAILAPTAKECLDQFDAALSRWPTMRELPLLKEKARANAKMVQET